MTKSGHPTSLRSLSLLGSSVGGISLLAPIIIILAIVAGRALDKWLGTTPWLLLALIFTSIFASLFLMVSAALQAGKQAQEQYMAGHRSEGDWQDDQ
nr:AtpZ/AtpI family protein [Anaerolineae bacterium]